MSYLVFARKYRPQVFDDIDGQPHIVTTLKNAIAQGKVAQAYIFSGPRGVGKTTAARILAKALNCEKGPTPDPCNSCPSCNEITQGSSLDVLEIDGASNRGIDEIRNLRENVKFKPSKGRFRGYIIDEVHMLTPEAFNALLKTLEEPPPHAKFIFATTQIHKVPMTILSRCQRFDFHRLSTKDIFENLKGIAANEKIDADDEALNLIATHSDGSMRDGQVVLDQVASSAQGNITSKDVVKMLGLVNEEVLFALADSIKAKDASKALEVIDQFISGGGDVLHLVINLIEHFRNLSVVKISKALGSIIEAGPDKIRRYESQAQSFTIEEILYIIYTFSNTIEFIKKTNLARIPFEASMIKLARGGSIMALADIVDRLTKLEERLGQVSHPGPEKIDEGHSLKKMQDKPVILTSSMELDEISSAWNSVLNHIRAKKISTASYLQEGYPLHLEGDKLLIGFPKESKFHKEVLEAPENRLCIEDAINAVMKLDIKVAFTLIEPMRDETEKTMGRTENIVLGADAGALDESPTEKETEPIIKDALEIFGGDITDKPVKKRNTR